MMARLLLIVALIFAVGGGEARRPEGISAENLEGGERLKKNPLGFNARGFHDDIFGQDFGVFHTVKRTRSLVPPRNKRALVAGKRRPEMGSSGFHGDTFSGGFGEFWTMKKSGHAKRDVEVPDEIGYSDIGAEKKSEKMYTLNGNLALGNSHKNCRLEEYHFLPLYVFGKGGHTLSPKEKENLEKIISAFLTTKSYDAGNKKGHLPNLFSKLNSVESQEITTDLKQPSEWKIERGSNNDNAASSAHEIWENADGHCSKINEPSFHSLADIWNIMHHNMLEKLQKRRPEMGSSGFHGNMFSNGFGEFWTMKKKANNMLPFEPTYLRQLPPMKRKPEMDSFGFHGDTFNNGFGDFWPMKKSTYEDPIFGGTGDQPVNTYNYTI